MRKPLAFHFDIVCPYAYLASTQVDALVQRCGATLSWHPFLLGGVLQSIGTDPMFTTRLSAPKMRHNRLDALRWADHLGVPFSWHPKHPIRTVTVMRALLLLADSDGVIADPTPIHALYRAYWVDHRPLWRPEVTAEVLSEIGLPGPSLVAQTQDPAVKLRLKTVSSALAQRGVFGAPAMFVDQQLFWGQDRLAFVEAALRSEAVAPPKHPAWNL